MEGKTIPVSAAPVTEISNKLLDYYYFLNYGIFLIPQQTMNWRAELSQNTVVELMLIVLGDEVYISSVNCRVARISN